MADLVFNVSKGKVAELFQNVDDNDPAAAVIRVFVFQITGGAAAEDAALRDADTIAAIQALGNVTEATNTNYANLSLDETDIAAIAPDDTNDRMDIDITSDFQWTAVASGTSWDKLIIAYDAAGTDTDANTVPLTAHDLTITPDGSDITIEVAAAGIFRAS